ncbi:MAG: VWA domain-containing protein [Defluviitaleaceae bacterium]|nr:VWA domain-containing protein [Defluviitaleaceae bacterium]
MIGHRAKSVMWLVYLAVSILFAFLFVHTPAVAEAPADGIDVILVIDTSGSMRTSDPERITLEAAQLFMDMMETRNSRIGIVGFSGGLHSVMPLTQINDPSIRNNIRRTISGFVYHGWTDIGLAMRTAAEMLINDPSPSNSPMILLFTDGQIELPTNWANNRTVEASYEDAWWAVDNVGDFAAIYTIGLNFDGTLNEPFLHEIAQRTSAKSYIASEADALPQIFNEIFASHIRSSITEIASIVADGETYADVIVPIPSLFVAEANIIMLSSRQIPGIRLFDPSGIEVPLGEEPYTLSFANRYSMIKVLSPMVGDWLLHVRGLPEDRITINLIYNYNVNVSLSVTQPSAEDGALYFDPSLPIAVQAGFVSSLPSSHFQPLFDGATVELAVYDMQHNLVATFPMVNTGSAFTLDFFLDPPQDVRVNVNVSHPHFEQTTAFFSITFDPEVLREIPAPPSTIPDEIEDTETPPEQPEPEETPSPVVATEPEDIETGSSMIFILMGIAVALAVAAILLRVISLRRIRNRVYTGHLELRALLSDGNYTSLEAPDISTFAGEMSLMEFLNNSLGGSKADKLVQSGIPIWDILLSPGMQGNQPIIQLHKKGSGCHITDGDGNSIFKKKIIWEDGQQLIFSIPGESPKLEITYRAFEN